ncbi:MAG: FAD-dependent monooxygenase [Woeseia sp.]
MKKRCEIVIAGAGVVGLAMAALLVRLPEQRRLRVTLVDRVAPASFNNDADVGLRVSAIATGSMSTLAALGVRDIVLTRACPYRDMRVWDATGDAYAADALHFSAAELALPELGFITEDALLRHALFTALEQDSVDFRFGAGIAALNKAQHVCEIELDDGASLQADLVIAADGARSVVREQAGIAVDGWDYRQAAFVTHARPAVSHQHTAWQRFLPDGPIALLPLADGRVSIVWSTTPEHARELKSMDDATLSAQLTNASAAVLGELDVAAPRASFPLRAQHAKHYVQEALALIGDAAHTVHPLAGQGANLGIADAAALAAVIGAALEAGEHPGDLPLLRRYERARRGANSTMLQFIDALNRMFATGSGIGELRQTGMRVFNHSGPLKRQAMKVAIGL